LAPWYALEGYLSPQTWLSHDKLRKYGGEHENLFVVSGLFVVYTLRRKPSGSVVTGLIHWKCLMRGPYIMFFQPMMEEPGWRSVLAYVKGNALVFEILSFFLVSISIL
jgi:hypothetical protein